MKSTLKRTLSVLLVFMMVISSFAGMSVFAANEDDPYKDVKPISKTDASNSDASGSDASGSDASDSDASGSDAGKQPVSDSVVTGIIVDSGNEKKDTVTCLGGSFSAVVEGKNLNNKIALFSGKDMIGKPVLVGSEEKAVSTADIAEGTFVLPYNKTDAVVEYVFRAYAAKTSDSDITVSAGDAVGKVYVDKFMKMVEVKPDYVSFSDKGGTADLVLRSNAQGTIGVENGGWITLASGNKDGAQVITVTAPENKGLDRECSILFRIEDEKAPFETRVTVFQEGAKGVERISGKTRVETAVAISKEGWDKAETVIIASGEKYPDALAGAPLSSAANAPILLTMNKDKALEKDVLDEITRLGARKVYILGGSGAVCEEIEKALTDAKLTVNRLSGKTRYGTAVKIAEELSKVTGKAFTKIYFASGENYPDALSISSVAAIEGNPILYMPKTKAVDADTSKFITDGKYKNGVLLGGTGAVSEAGETSLTKLEMTIERVYGKTRYTTSQEINKKYAALFTGKKMAVATGENFPDALAGGGLCAKLKMPVVLVSDKAADSALEYIKGAAPEGLIVLGGAGAVSDEVAVKLAGGVKLPAAEADKK